MGKKKSKSDEQLPFIHFANCEFESNSLLRFFQTTIKYISAQTRNNELVIENNLLDLIKSLLCSENFRFCKPIDDFFTKVIKPIYKTFLRTSSTFDDMENENIRLNFLKEKMKTMGPDYRRLADKLDRGDLGYNPYDNWVKKPFLEGYDFIFEIAFSYYELRDILKKVMMGLKIEQNLLVDLMEHNIDKINSLGFGQDTYLEEKYLPTEEMISPHRPIGELVANFFSKLIFYDLIKFLCSSDWRKLKQCEECSKFWVAKVNRGDIRFCSKKCKQDNCNREYTKSGKHAEYMREKRPEKPKWIT